MRLKKNYFKHLEHGINTPVKQINFQGLATKGVKKIMNSLNKLTLPNLEGVPPEVIEMINEDPRNLDINNISTLNPPGHSDLKSDPRNPDYNLQNDYNTRTHIRPHSSTFGDQEDKSGMENLQDVVYNNPFILSAASKLFPNRTKEFIKNQMNMSGSSAAVDLNAYKDWITNTKESNAEVLQDNPGLTPEKELELKKNNPNYEIKLQKELTEAEYNKEYGGYTGGNYTGETRHWREGGAQPVDQFLSSKPLFKVQTKKPKSDFYDFMKSYSIKGDDFDKPENLNQINTDLAGGGGTGDTGLTRDLISATLGTSPDQQPGYEDLSKEESDKLDIAWKNKTSKFNNLTNRQMIPFLTEHMMMQTKDVKGGYVGDPNDEDNWVPGLGEGYSAEGGFGDGDYGAYGGNKPNPIMDSFFKKLYSGDHQSKFTTTPGIMVGSGDESGDISSFLDVDMGKGRVGFGMDEKLPYMSTSDAWDFQATGRGGYTNWGSGDAFKQAQLLQHAGKLFGGGGFKNYDRFNFTPDKYRDYIPEKDVDFHQEFYGAQGYGENEDNIQPLIDEPVVINVSKKEEEKTPGTTKFEKLKTRQ